MNLSMSARLAAWLALVALVLNTLWPFTANAEPSGIAQEICSADASKYSNNGYGPAKLPPGEHRLRHCALCLPSAHSALATPPSFPWLTRLPKASTGRLEAGPLPPQRVYLHPHAQPRAPPLYA
jgi:hypothetical protein